jgi:hypothetical protein
VVTSLRKYHYSLRDSPEEGSSLLFYSTCLEVHFLAGLCIKRKHFTYMTRFQVGRSPATFVVEAQSSLNKTQVMLSKETIKEIAKFICLVTTLTNKPTGIFCLDAAPILVL